MNNERYDWPAVLEWIRQTYRETGWPVTLRQITREFGISSTSVLNAHCKAWIVAGQLESQGHAKTGLKPPHKEIVL